MAEQLARPKDQVEVYWFSEQAQGYVTDGALEQFESGRLGFPNSHFDPDKAHVLYGEYHDQYALADEVGFDGIILCLITFSFPHFVRKLQILRIFSSSNSFLTPLLY